MKGRSPERRGGDRADRWVERPFVASAIRVVVLLVPLATGFLAALGVGRSVPRPGGLADVAWAVGVLLVSSVTVTVVDRVSRRLLPLATLLRLSLVFPDRVPSRFRLAREAGNVRVLKRRVAEARERGLDDDPSRAAEQILTLVAALSAHDRKTRGHSERVRAFTDMLAGEFDLPEGDRDRLRWASLLHDTGKLEVPAATLNKPGKPDEEEWARLRRHPIEGERITAPLLPRLGPWAAAIGQHHERWDGTGYPRGLAGEDISLGARIVAVADSFEVMTAARSYKRPMTPRAARRELERCAGDQFDPQVVRAFLNISLGRLWWAVGPAAWIAQIPFMLRIGQTGGEAIGLAKAATAVAVNGLAGILALGVGFGSPPPQVPAPAPAAVRATGWVAPAGGATVQPDGGAGEIAPESPPDVGGDDDPVPAVETDPAESPPPSPSPDGASTPPPPSDEGTPDDRDVRPDPEPVTERDEPSPPPRGDTVDQVVDVVDETVEEVVDVVRDVVPDVEETVDDVEEAMEDVVDTVEETVDSVVDTVDDTVGGVIGRLLP